MIQLYYITLLLNQKKKKKKLQMKCYINAKLNLNGNFPPPLFLN